MNMSRRFDSSFGAYLRRLRTTSGMTQEALAERSGLSVDAISALENERRRRPRTETIDMLADALGLAGGKRKAFETAARMQGRPRAAYEGTTATTLLEREMALAAVARLLDQACAGMGGALFLVGEPGLGKSSLLAHVQQLAGSRLRTAVATGDPMESALPFGLFVQLLDDLGGQDLLMFGDGAALDDGDVNTTNFHRVLRFLRERIGGPLLMAFDDLHWSDGDSLALLSFICRRISSLPVAVIATLRLWPPEAEQLCLGLAQEDTAMVERLLPLSEAAVARLLAARLGSVLDAEPARRAWKLSGGNPLLVDQIAVSMTRGELPDGVAMTRNGLLLSRFAGLPEAGMACARAASVLGVHFRSEVALELAQLDEAASKLALESLWESGLVRAVDPEQLEFAHPLFQHALYDGLGPPWRQRLHARAFAALRQRGLEAEAAEHALPGRLFGEPTAIELMERRGREAHRAGAVASALRLLDGAITLAGSGVEIGLQLYRANVLVNAGRPQEASEVCERVLASEALLPATRAEALRVLGAALHAIGLPAQAAAQFRDAVMLIAGNGEQRAVDTLLHCAVAHWCTGGARQSLPFVAQARELAADAPTRERERVEAAWALFALAGGDPAGLGPVVQLAVTAERHPDAYLFGDHLGWQSDLASLASALRVVERFADAERLTQVGIALAEPGDAPNVLGGLLRVSAEALTRRGRLREAHDRFARASRLGGMTPATDGLNRVSLAGVLLLMGRLEESDACAEPVEDLTRGRHWMPLLRLWELRGHRLLREGRPEEASRFYEQAEELADRMGLEEPCWVPWARHAVAAHAGCGRLDAAKRVTARLDWAAARLPCHWPRIAAATSRAFIAQLVGDTAAVDRHYRAALALHGHVALPIEHVETLLDYGAFLRQSGPPVQAKTVLAEAVGRAEECSAGWLAWFANRQLDELG